MTKALRMLRRYLPALGFGFLAGATMPSTVLAADFGSGCCADLEERIAELEATAARKGNRKLSLAISGQVNQAIMVWDDRFESNAYLVMNSNSGDRLRFEGSAQISGDLRAGYFLELGSGLASSGSADQFDARARADGPFVRQSLWYFDSRTYGALTMGYGSTATDDIIAYNLGGSGVAASANMALVGGNLFTRDATIGGGAGLNALSAGNTISLRWRRFVDRLDTPRANMVRYDSPVLMGFTASASWGEDDSWDAALRFAHSSHGFRFVAGAGYYEDGNETADTLGWPRGGDTEPNARETKITEFKGSASLLHMPTGLFVSAAYLHREFSGNDLGTLTFACFGSGDAADIRAQGVACTNRPDFDYTWISAGIKQKFSSLGYTTLYGEYARSQDAVTGLNVSLASATGRDLDYVTDSSMTVWGLGIVQQIRAAQMDLYFSYRHMQAEIEGLESGGGFVDAHLEDADVFLAGSRVRF